MTIQRALCDKRMFIQLRFLISQIECESSLMAALIVSYRIKIQLMKLSGVRTNFVATTQIYTIDIAHQLYYHMIRGGI